MTDIYSDRGLLSQQPLGDTGSPRPVGAMGSVCVITTPPAPSGLAAEAYLDLLWRQPPELQPSLSRLPGSFMALTEGPGRGGSSRSILSDRVKLQLPVTCT